ncbi:YgaP family membrane protein [Desulfolucanica intricata]|uniref:YgaP family membrane protein n=1 Tax=Desulfolucanica intricata TaxID=1285191 RepID=UPI000A8DD10C|nr:DUF2892 domain-containing protein [Desulfolucanica intricata]
MKLNFKRNLGNTDRVIRATIGLLLLVFVYTTTLSGLWGTLAIVFAFSQFIEAALGY